MATEDPTLVTPSRKASRRRALTCDLMRQLSKLDAISAKAEQLAKAARFQERRIERQLREIPRLARAH